MFGNKKEMMKKEYIISSKLLVNLKLLLITFQMKTFTNQTQNTTLGRTKSSRIVKKTIT